MTTPDQARQCRYLPIVSPRSIDAWGQAASRPAAAMAGMCPGLQRGTYGRSLAARCTASLSLPTDRCDLGTDRQVRVALCSPAARRGDCVWRFVRRTVSTTASAECCCHNVTESVVGTESWTECSCKWGHCQKLDVDMPKQRMCPPPKKNRG